MIYVIMSHNFDAEIYIWEFENSEKAKAFLHWSWEDYYNTEIALESYLVESQCFHEESYAKVEWADGCYTEWNMIEGTDTIPEEFEKEWEKYIP